MIAKKDAVVIAFRGVFRINRRIAWWDLAYRVPVKAFESLDKRLEKRLQWPRSRANDDGRAHSSKIPLRLFLGVLRVQDSRVGGFGPSVWSMREG